MHTLSRRSSCHPSHIPAPKGTPRTRQMGNWRELSLATGDLLRAYQRLEIPLLKSAAGALVFEDPQKEAVLAAAMLARTLFTRLGVKVKYRCLEPLRGRRLCFVANHPGGNLDALILGLIILLEKGKVPYIPTSQRLLDAQLLGPLNEYLKYLGTFFIRTQFRDDPVYIAEVAYFMDAVLDQRQHICFFPEGNTSRHGKPLPFRHGLLKSLVARSVSFCPVSISYESSLFDSGTSQRPLGLAQLGMSLAQRGFSLPDMVTGGSRHRRLGTVFVTFGECYHHTASPGQSLSTACTTVTSALTTQICGTVPILSTDVVAALLLQEPGMDLETLSVRTTAVEGELRRLPLAFIHHPLPRALAAVQHLLRRDGDRIFVVDAAGLTYYRNRLLPALFGLVELGPLRSLLRYECLWAVTHSGTMASPYLQALATTACQPLVQVYQVLLGAYGRGVTETAALEELVRSLTVEAPSMVSNFLRVMEEERAAASGEAGR